MTVFQVARRSADSSAQTGTTLSPRWESKRDDPNRADLAFFEPMRGTGYSFEKASKYPGQVFETQPGSRITTPGTRNPARASAIAIRWSS